jgi:hypothetical protein
LGQSHHGGPLRGCTGCDKVGPADRGERMVGVKVTTLEQAETELLQQQPGCRLVDPGLGDVASADELHFPYGRQQVYPGGRFNYHLKPFIAALEAGTSQIMPYYGMPIGTDYEPVGVSFSSKIITDLLRRKLGFDGIVCTDWQLLNDTVFAGEPMLARAWGRRDRRAALVGNASRCDRSQPAARLRGTSREPSL